MDGKSTVIKCRHFTWENRVRKQYKDDQGESRFKNVHRYTLLNGRASRNNLNFETRYFEIQPGGYTTFEYHNHPHSVIVIRGNGKVIIGDEIKDIGLHDVVYVAPDTPHQFQAADDEPLGFLCIVDQNRDRPVIPDDEELKELIASNDVRKQIKR